MPLSQYIHAGANLRLSVKMIHPAAGTGCSPTDRRVPEKQVYSTYLSGDTLPPRQHGVGPPTAVAEACAV